jgi:cation diffusion facilitator family transporter
LNKAKENIRLQQWVVVIAVILFFLKLAAYYLTQSIAVLTDALESTVNVIAGVIGLYSLYVAAKPSDEDHPYGHGKAEFLSAAVEGSLVIMAGCIIIYQAIMDFIHPHAIQKLDKGIYLIALTAVINFIIGTISIYKGRKNGSMALVASGKHLRTDTWSTAGIIVGLIIIYYTHITVIDAIVSLIFAGIIIYTGYQILRGSIAGIMDEADMQLLRRMVAYLNTHRRQNWVDLHNLRVIKYGGLLHVDCHLTLPWYLNLVEAHAEIDVLTALIRKEFGEAVEFFVHTDACMDFQCPICTKEDCAVRKHAFEARIEWDLKNVVANKKHERATPTVVEEQLKLDL